MRASFVSPDLFDGGLAAWPFAPLEPLAYQMIMADPPWRFENYSEKGEAKGAAPHYRTMTDDDILALPLADLAAEHCVLWLWATFPKLPLAVECVRAWGFEFKTGGAWDKKRWGTGYVWRNVCEPILIATRGEPKCAGASISNLIVESRREHSRKPEAAYRAAAAMLPNARRADLFSRAARPGWEAWGDEAGVFDDGTARRPARAGRLSEREPARANDDECALI